MAVRARATDPETSHAAAGSADRFIEYHFALIRQALKKQPATIHELAGITGLTHVQVARRLPELEEALEVRPSGATREGPSGRRCRVWVSNTHPFFGSL